jgi:hypothetical protein
MPTQVKYTKRGDDTGWLRVRLSSPARDVFLCEYTKVEISREEGGRVFFLIAEGNTDHVGKEASLRKQNADIFLKDTAPGGPATMEVSYTGAPAEEVSRFKGRLKQQWAQATFNRAHAQVTLNSVWDGTYTPIPAGNHKIMAPDVSHANISTAGYRSATPGLRCTDVWFPIELSGSRGNSSRYIHVGHLSEGCVTVHELTAWNSVYDYLISHRLPGNNGKYVGNLTVRR